MNQFDNVAPDEQRELMSLVLKRKAMGMMLDRSVNDMARNSKQILSDNTDDVKDTWNYILKNFKVSDSDLQKLAFVHSLIDSIFKDAKFVDRSDQTISADRITSAADVMRIAGKTIDGLTGQPLLKLIYTGVLTDFLVDFFQKSDTRQNASFVNTYKYVLKMVEAEEKALLDNQNIDLQEFYGQDGPKSLRGQLKTESNPIFKNTDDLTKFLNQYFFVE